MSTIEERNGSYRIVVMHKGQRSRVTLGVVPNSFAETKAARIDELLTLLKGGYITIPDTVTLTDFLQHDGKAPQPVEDAPEAAPAAPEVTSLARLRGEYLSAHRGSLEANTLDGIETHFKHFVDTLGGDFAIGTLTLVELQKHANRRAGMKNKKGEPISPVTIKKDFVALRAAWNWGVHAGLVEGLFPPIKRIRLGKIEEKPPFQTRDEIERKLELGGLSKAEVDALWECLYLKPDEVREFLEHVHGNASPPWLYPMVCMAAHTGARRSELIRMEAGDADIEGAGEVTIRERKRVHGAKTTRRVTLTPFLKSVLREWFRVRPASKFLFSQSGTIARSKKRSRTTGHKGQKTRAKSLSGRQESVVIRETQGISQITLYEAGDHFDRVRSGSKWDVLRGWHVLRHSACSAMAAAGVDQRIIDEVMGHSTEEQRRRYRHLTPTSKAEAMQKAFGQGSLVP